MGIKDFFSSSGRREKRLDKLVRTVTNKYTQSVERYGAMQHLLEDGSEDALVGLLKRFTITSTKSIEDEEEKGWVYRELTDLGPKLTRLPPRAPQNDDERNGIEAAREGARTRVLSACKRFCLSHENVAWALRIIEDLAHADEEWDILEALLDKHPPEYERDSSAKIQVLTHLSEIEDARVPAIVLRYLEDPDENVRFFAVEALSDIGDESARVPLIARLTNATEDSVRLKSRILDGLAQLGWDVSAHKAEIAPHLGHEHVMEAGKIVRR